MKTWGASIMPTILKIMVGIEKGHFFSFGPEYPGSHLKVVHLFQLEYLTEVLTNQFFAVRRVLLVRDKKW